MRKREEVEMFQTSWIKERIARHRTPAKSKPLEDEDEDEDEPSLVSPDPSRKEGA
jgi:hypothetical protein